MCFGRLLLSCPPRLNFVNRRAGRRRINFEFGAWTPPARRANGRRSVIEISPSRCCDFILLGVLSLLDEFARLRPCATFNGLLKQQQLQESALLDNKKPTILIIAASALRVRVKVLLLPKFSVRGDSRKRADVFSTSIIDRLKKKRKPAKSKRASGGRLRIQFICRLKRSVFQPKRAES